MSPNPARMDPKEVSTQTLRRRKIELARAVESTITTIVNQTVATSTTPATVPITSPEGGDDGRAAVSTDA